MRLQGDQPLAVAFYGGQQTWRLTFFESMACRASMGAEDGLLDQGCCNIQAFVLPTKKNAALSQSNRVLLGMQCARRRTP
jgi:hypothetical protein